METSAQTHALGRLYSRHWTASRVVVQLLWPESRMRCERHAYLAVTPPSNISIFFGNGIRREARSCLRLYNFNLVWRAARAKRVRSAGGVGTPEMVFYARSVFNGAHMWRWGLGV